MIGRALLLACLWIGRGRVFCVIIMGGFAVEAARQGDAISTILLGKVTSRSLRTWGLGVFVSPNLTRINAPTNCYDENEMACRGEIAPNCYAATRLMTLWLINRC